METPAPMNDTTPPAEEAKPTVDPRRRMRELLAIPDGQRTDAQWDELNELEIQLAQVNRIGPAPAWSGDPGQPRKSEPGGAPQKPRGNLQRKAKAKRPGKPFHKPKGPPPGAKQG